MEVGATTSSNSRLEANKLDTDDSRNHLIHSTSPNNHLRAIVGYAVGLTETVQNKIYANEDKAISTTGEDTVSGTENCSTARCIRLASVRPSDQQSGTTTSRKNY